MQRMEGADGHHEDGFQPRPLTPDDYFKGYLDLLSQLTLVGDVSSHEFAQRFQEIMIAENSPYFIAVVEAEGRIVATGTLLIEKKFIHQCGVVGHIEDVVVDARMRGHCLGQRIVDFLTTRAREAHCYKVILDCDEQNVRFYEKCGFSKKETQMARYLT
ncbi:hypothetical protein L7F22_048309 [Adiantum nelumboides]|nr:hypothetical protein [Adiantum nelumboides]